MGAFTFNRKDIESQTVALERINHIESCLSDIESIIAKKNKRKYSPQSARFQQQGKAANSWKDCEELITDAFKTTDRFIHLAAIETACAYLEKKCVKYTAKNLYLKSYPTIGFLVTHVGSKLFNKDHEHSKGIFSEKIQQQKTTARVAQVNSWLNILKNELGLTERLQYIKQHPFSP